jgi:hypothetical protein
LRLDEFAGKENKIAKLGKTLKTFLDMNIFVFNAKKLFHIHPKTN